jgi:hypothetical protein
VTISPLHADIVLLVSLLVSLCAYVVVSEREGSYLNVMTVSYLTGIPAYYLLPLFFLHIEGNDASTFAYVYVYLTIAVENVLFAYAYLRPTRTIIRLPFRYSYAGFTNLSIALVGLAALMYLPILLQFPEYIFSPRRIYEQTRVGFGVSYYISSTLAYLAVVLIQFSGRSRWTRWGVVLVAAAVLLLHGSKGQVLSLVFLVALFEVYVHKRKLGLLASMAAASGLGALILALFAASMVLEGSAFEVVQAISEYSDYTRNAMLVIDSHFPVQYGRLTLEGHIYGRIPRALMPNKPKNFGALYLDDQFYPGSLDEEAGSPDFGIGVQYADFGFLAIVYLGLFALLRGWMARVFVYRLDCTRHPADLFMVAFLANVSLFPVGGGVWYLPEALFVTMFLRFASCLGAKTVYREHVRHPAFMLRPRPSTMDGLEGAQHG